MDMRGGHDGEYDDPDYYESIKLRGAAGVFFASRKTRRILLAHRSDSVDMPRHWGGFGGAIDEGETAEECVRREIEEEAGWKGSYELHPVFCFKSPTFRYQNFVAFVDEEFRPRLNWENTDAQWFDIKGLPHPMHPGMIACLDDELTKGALGEHLSLSEGVSPDLIHNPKNIDPALMTFAEYRSVVNPKGTTHDSKAYDTGIESLNQHFRIEEYSRVIRQFRVNGLSFALRVKREEKWGDTYAITNEEGECVGSLQDEWGCTLIMVAREYRGFGLGTLLGKLALLVTPSRPTGGETPGGYDALKRAHADLVADALRSGRYREMIAAGEITRERVRKIIDTARASKSLPREQRDLSNRDPRDLLLYGSDTTFVVYNRRLKDIIEDADDFWIDKMVKGMVHFSYHVASNGQEYGIIYRFGGESQSIRTFLLRCAAYQCEKEGVTLLVDEEDLGDVDSRYLGQSHVHRITGNPRADVFSMVDLDPTAMIEQEAAFRTSFDQRDEFYYRMVELADAKFRPEQR
jgi:8-oxo-dGTP pyrophosphatase MutT (NUDIX family)